MRWGNNYWAGSNTAEVARALIAYYRATKDAGVLEKLRGLDRWLIGMQSPSGSFFMKKGYTTMEYEVPEGRLIDNSLVSVEATKQDRVTVRRGYEPLPAMEITATSSLSAERRASRAGRSI